MKQVNTRKTLAFDPTHQTKPCQNYPKAIQELPSSITPWLGATSYAERAPQRGQDGAVLLKTRHRYTAWTRLPPSMRPDQRITLALARGFATERLTMERPCFFFFFRLFFWFFRGGWVQWGLGYVEGILGIEVC